MKHKSSSNNGAPKKFGPHSRLTGGLEISKKEGWIRENQDGSFSVPSQTTPEVVYRVRVFKGEWTCNCPDFSKNFVKGRQFECKHIYGTKFWIATKTYLKSEQPKPKIFADDSLQCDRCGSIRVIRYGKSGRKQVYFCNDCKYKFNEDTVVKNIKYNADLVTLISVSYFSGLSLRRSRNVNDHFNMKLNSPAGTGWKVVIK